ncbi:MAG: FHA domain-containing protein [Acidobacteriota bacterium]
MPVMATMEHGTSGRRVRLTARNLIGRASSCLLRLDDPRVSGEHASLRWEDDGWIVQDLHSRNGTHLGGRRLDAGERAGLGVGSELAFGNVDDTWQVVDVDPPVASAQADDGEHRFAQHGLLSLPSEETPAVQVRRDGGERWVAEGLTGVEPVTDQHLLAVADRLWRLHLPEALARTWEPAAPPPSIDTIGLRFTVSSDEEHVDVTLLHDGDETALPHRAHAYLLLTLARLRERDSENEELPVAEQGWEYQDELLRMLDLGSEQLHLAVFRARQQLANAGVEGASGLIERRRGSKQLRLGIGQLEILSA